MTHVITRALQRCNPHAFGLTAESAIRKAQSAVSKLAAEQPGLREYLLIVAKSAEMQRDAEKLRSRRSRGDLLCAIVRYDAEQKRRYIATMILRRSGQRTRLDGLRYVIVQSGQIIIL